MNKTKTASIVWPKDVTPEQRARVMDCDHFPLNAYTGDALWFTCPDCGGRFLVMNAKPQPDTDKP